MKANALRAGALMRLALPFLIGLFATAGPVSAGTPAVYHSPLDDGAPAPGGIPNLPSGVDGILHLYIDGGPNPSVADPCESGDGDEVCGFDLSLTSLGAVSFVSFVPDGDVVYQLQPTQLRFNGGRFDVGDLGPTRLGDLVVSSTGDGGVFLDEGYSVSSTLDLRKILARPIIGVPEPGPLPALAAGAALLAVVHRRRRRTL